jgi:arabinogalactan endo-1,4-beta-galactosidase
LKRVYVLLIAAALGGCSQSGGDGSGMGGATGATGAAGGGAGGTATGGATATGGVTATGSVTGMGGATATGGASGAGGARGTGAAGGAPGTGGAKAGDAGGAGGKAGGTGGAATGGSGGTGGGAAGAGGSTTLSASYDIGADISDQETQPAATRANLLTLMKAHGFNYVRLRTFVDPKAADGYDKTNGYDDITHTVAFGQQVKAAGMGLLVDFHYSDNWADAGKQCVPTAWQGDTLAQMVTAVHDYTSASITALITGGARPDMVQIGNEETPGILIHTCDADGLPKAGIAGYSAVNGAIYLYSSTDGAAPPAGGPAAGGWTNLGMLLNAAAKGVKDVDGGIKIALHLDRGNDLSSSKSFIQNAMAKSVPFDIFGESCYAGTQGQPSDWTTTFTSLATSYPNLKFTIAEYSTDQRQANDVMFNLPSGQGIGTFNWQPSDLWTRVGASYTAQTDMMLYDLMATAYAARL